MTKPEGLFCPRLMGSNAFYMNPAPRAILTDPADSSVNLQPRFWTEDPLDNFNLKWEHTEKCKKSLDAAGIQIPFPHRQLFLERSEGLLELAGQ